MAWKTKEEIEREFLAKKQRLLQQARNKAAIENRKRREEYIINVQIKMNQHPKIDIMTHPDFINHRKVFLNNIYFDENNKLIRSLDDIPF